MAVKTASNSSVVFIQRSAHPGFGRIARLCFLGIALGLACWPLGTALAADAQPVPDVLLQGGTIYDGSGAAAIVGDIALRNGKVVAVGKYAGPLAHRTIDCKGLVVAPGFIDLHTHCSAVGSLAVRRNLNYLKQGCTTVVTGSCGGGTSDIAAECKQVAKQGVGVNVVYLVPHGSIRQKAMGGANRAPTADELQRMKELVDREMRAGAWGMSSGLIYAPSMFAKTDELVELSKVVARHGGLYVSHIRGESGTLLTAMREAIDIGRQAKLPVQISHFKGAGKSTWGKVREAAKLIEEARASGVRVTADQYPYLASSTSLGATLYPPTEFKSGLKDFAKRIADDPAFQEEVRAVVARRLGDNPRIVIASCKKHPEWVGKSLDDIAKELKTDLVGAANRVQIDGGASIVRFVLCEEDVRFVMSLPWVATGSDGSSLVPSAGTRPHPRSFGTFPRKIGYYAQGEKVLPVTQAIRSATGLPADILALPERGYLRAGYVADVVVFDPHTFIDRATFDDPQQYSTGVRWLFLAGNAAIDDGQPAEKLYGQTLLHADKQPMPKPGG